MGETSKIPEDVPFRGPKSDIKNRVILILGIVTVVLVISNILMFTMLQGQVDDLTTEKNTLQTQVEDLTDIVNLEKTAKIVDNQTVGQAANTYTSWTFSADYAGYVKVQIHSSTTSNTTISVYYESASFTLDEKISVGSTGSVVYPIIPTDLIEVRIGNTNSLNSATERVSVTYHY